MQTSSDIDALTTVKEHIQLRFFSTTKKETTNKQWAKATIDEQEKAKSKMINTDYAVYVGEKKTILMILTYLELNVTIMDSGFIFLVIISNIEDDNILACQNYQ